MSRHLPATVGMAPSDVTISALNFASLSSPSSLANSCTFSIGIWRNIRNLVRLALATVLGRRREVLFLVRLKNRRDFSPNSLCLNCNAHGLGGILFFQEKRKLGTSEEFQECSFQGALYRRRSLGKLIIHRVQGKNVKQNEFHLVPKGAFSL